MFDLKKERKKKKDSLEKAIVKAEKELNKIYDLLEVVKDEFISINEKNDVVITANILMEIAEAMGEDHIDFMGMA
jgi:hypothetical protein